MSLKTGWTTAGLLKPIKAADREKENGVGGEVGRFNEPESGENEGRNGDEGKHHVD